jgi:hypothetical protein
MRSNRIQILASTFILAALGPVACRSAAESGLRKFNAHFAPNVRVALSKAVSVSGHSCGQEASGRLRVVSAGKERGVFVEFNSDFSREVMMMSGDGINATGRRLIPLEQEGGISARAASIAVGNSDGTVICVMLEDAVADATGDPLGNVILGTCSLQ